MDTDKHIDESWKDAADRDKKIIGQGAQENRESPELHISEPFKKDDDEEPSVAEQGSNEQEESAGEGFEVNFLNYITSLGYQALIFMGEYPHPSTGQVEKDLVQSKILIDTLIMMRDKTKGNLTEQEDNILGASVYELQIKYVEAVKKDGSSEPKESA